MSDGGRRTEDGRRRTEDGRRKTEDRRIDLAIDGAVREMLDVEPPAGMRARVLRRIEARSLPPEGGSYMDGLVASAFRRKIWIIAPLAAAAILILAVLLPRSASEPQPKTPSTTVRVETPTSPVTAPPTTPSVTPPTISPRTPIVEHPRAAAARTPQPTAHPVEGRQPVERMVTAAVFAPAANATTDIAPLKTITPIQVTPVTDEAIAPEEITVRPLNPMNELAIAPLTPPERRN